MRPERAGIATSEARGSAPRRRIMMVAGEASGDLHGADLAAQLLARDPGLELFGIAGLRMREAGVRALMRTEQIAGMGGTELAATIRPALRAFGLLRAALRENPPALVVLIDFADFNMKFAWFARRAGVPVLYYILPQVWAWRRWRVRTLIRRSDRMAVVFPFERELYARAGDRVSFVGHPLLDRIASVSARADTLVRHGLAPDARLLALLPGSRRGEVRYLLRPMLEAAHILGPRHRLTPVIALAPTLSAAALREAAEGASLASVQIIEADTYSIVAASELALVASGTASLETALLGCPMVIAYRMSGVSYAVARALVRGVDFIGMPNILAGKKIVPELIQREVTAERLVAAAEPLLSEPLRGATVAALGAVRNRLGAPGAAARVAAIALEMLE
jgi:lipid-A-disaccharide synthase